MAYSARLWALARGEVDANAYGTVDWVAVNGAWRARLLVAARGFDAGECVLEMVVRPGPRAIEPSVLLMASQTVVRRVDVNGVHREDGRPRRQTHVQGEPPPGYVAWLNSDEFPDLPADDPVSGEIYYRVFTAAAATLGVDVQGVEWIDPPEGRPS